VREPTIAGVAADFTWQWSTALSPGWLDSGAVAGKSAGHVPREGRACHRS